MRLLEHLLYGVRQYKDQQVGGAPARVLRPFRLRLWVRAAEQTGAAHAARAHHDLR